MLKKMFLGLTVMSMTLLVIAGCASTNTGSTSVTTQSGKANTDSTTITTQSGKEVTIINEKKEPTEDIIVKKIEKLENYAVVGWLNSNEIIVNKRIGSYGPYPKFMICSYNLIDKKEVTLLSSEDNSFELIELSNDKKHLLFSRGYMMFYHKTIGIFELSSKKITILAEEGGLNGCFFIDNKNIGFTNYRDPKNNLYTAGLDAKIKNSYTIPNKNLQILGFNGKKLLLDDGKKFVNETSDQSSDIKYYESNIDMSDLKLKNNVSNSYDVLFSSSTKDKSQTVIVKKVGGTKKSLLLLDSNGKEKDVLLENCEYETLDTIHPTENYIRWTPDEKSIIIEQFSVDNIATLVSMDVKTKRTTTLLIEKNIQLRNLIFSQDGKNIIVSYYKVLGDRPESSGEESKIINIEYRK